ncbi:MAG: hypothetical protein A4E67_00058 [Syntrophaceae bacterium PtaB.Bin038]|nr:MAG: hypothetical protein A4E67_00058 [Syntrophaceae bacterium PtaB.Bin038]
MNCSKETMVDTGLPGRPKRGFPSSRPKASGRPGRMATRQNWIRLPISAMMSFTRS